MSTYLMHHGIKGQRWGVRRFQNEDGTLTPEGQKRYSDLAADMNRLSDFKKPHIDGLRDAFIDSRKTNRAFYKAAESNRNKQRYENQSAKFKEKEAKAREAGKEGKAAKYAMKGKNAAELALEEERVFKQSIDTISREQTKYGKERVDYWLAKNAYNMSVTEIMTDTSYYRYYDAEKHYNLQRMNDRLTGRS